MEEKKSPAKPPSSPKIAKGATSFRLPSPDLLRPAPRHEKIEEDELKECAHAIEQKCQEFDISGRMTQINPGPVVTTYEFKPEAGIKYSRITGLADDLCLALKAESILIERIPGKSTVGIEVPNANRQTIALREQIESAEFVNSPSKLTLALGKDLIGRNRVSDLCANAPLADRRIDGNGQERFPQLPDSLDALQGHARRIENGDDRSEAAGAWPVRRHPAPARAGGHRSQSRVQRFAQRHARNGIAPKTARRARRPQHRSVQPHIPEGPVALALRRRRKTPSTSRCPTSSSSSTNSPT